MHFFAIMDKGAASPPTKQRPRADALSIITLFVLFLGGTTVFSCNQLQKNWSSASKTLVPSKMLAEGSSLHDIMERRQRYYHMYQYHHPNASHSRRVPDSTCGAAPDFADYFAQGHKLRSANDEDRAVYKLFSKLFHQIGCDGTYVEMGAFDGVDESNSRFFDVCLGWSGLLIEANPTMYQKLLPNRPNAHRMSFAPSCSAKEEQENKTLQFHDFPYTNAGLAGHALSYKDNRVVEVPCGSLTPVLQDVLNGHVDFFSLDVEGSEPSVVDNINFDAVFIEILMVEHTNVHCQIQCESRDHVRARLQQANYTRYSNVIHKSDLYIHQKSKYRLTPGEYKTISVSPHIATGSA